MIVETYRSHIYSLWWR